MIRGDDSSTPLTVYEPDDPSTPYDLTAATLLFTVSDRPGGTVLWTKSGGDGIVVDSPATAGNLTVSISASDWTSWVCGWDTLHWDLQATRFALVNTLARGTITVVQDVTR